MSIEEVKKVLRERPELLEMLPPLYLTLARGILSDEKKTTERSGGESPRSTHRLKMEDGKTHSDE